MTVPAWEFAVERYARPGVQAACLELQDRHGVDVATLLTLVWAGEVLRITDAAVVAAVVAAAEPVRTQVVPSIRSARRAVKGFPGADDLYRELLAVELAAERLQIDTQATAAERFAPAAPGASPATHEVAGDAAVRLLTHWLPNMMADPTAAELVARVL